jgi:hypothetical protein
VAPIVTLGYSRYVSCSPIYDRETVLSSRLRRRRFEQALLIMAMPDPVFFVSYARADTEAPEFREYLKKFVEDLRARVAVQMPDSRESICFMDAPDIQIGEAWSDALADALGRCRVGVVFYSPNYFAGKWCGKEFQVFLDRSHPGQGGTGIVPVLWEKITSALPHCTAGIQYDNETLPREYKSMGMAMPYQLALAALADRIVKEARALRLEPLANLDSDAVVSAWDRDAAIDHHSHMRGNITKTCFVYVSREGWGWVPYVGNASQIGALAQRISGELGFRYEELPCDDSLPRKLEEANASDVPTVLFGDPDSLFDERYARPMRKHDSQLLLNCATLLAWEPTVKDKVDEDDRWKHIASEVFRQKVQSALPHHEFRSIFSLEDLASKTRTTIEQIRSRLLKEMVNDPAKAASLRRAKNRAMSQDAADRGINTDSLPHLAGVTE